MPSGDDRADSVSRDHFRRLEARLDARLQEVTARLVLHDGRFAAMADRLNQADRRADALAGRVDARLGAIDHRFDALDTRIDILDTRVVDLLDQAATLLHDHRTTLLRATIVGTTVTVLINAALLASTFLLSH